MKGSARNEAANYLDADVGGLDLDPGHQMDPISAPKSPIRSTLSGSKSARGLLATAPKTIANPRKSIIQLDRDLRNKSRQAGETASKGHRKSMMLNMTVNSSQNLS